MRDKGYILLTPAELMTKYSKDNLFLGGINRYSEAAVLGVTPTTVPHALPLEIRFLLFGVR